MGELKKYLQQHKDEMDFDEPGPLVWNKIATPPPKKQPGKLVRLAIRSAAAAAVLLIMTVTGIKYFSKEKAGEAIPAIAKKEPLPVNKTTDIAPPVIVAEIKDPVKRAPQLAVTNPKKKQDERYALMNSFKDSYGQLVSYQLQSIRTTPVYAENPAYFDDFKTRLHQMDLDEINIRKNIRKNGISNALIEQLINVYQQKLDVLKSLQQEINKMNTRVQQDMPVDSMNKFYLNI